MGWWSPIYLNEQIPFLDAIDDFSPTFSHFFPNSTFYTLKSGGRTHGSHGSHGSIPSDTTRRTPRVGRKNRTARPFAPGPIARPSSPTDHCTNTGLLGEADHPGLPQIGMSIFSISMKLYVFFGFLGGTSILTHIQMWKLVHKCLVC